MKFRSRKRQAIDEARRIYHLTEIERLRARGGVPSTVADLEPVQKLISRIEQLIEI